MILPILAFGHADLTKPCLKIGSDHPVRELIANMWDTMHNANGCGLAASQVGALISLFIVDSKTTYENMEPGDRLKYFEGADCGIKEVFINAKITEYSRALWQDGEGCLSIPGISQKVKRSWSITIEYHDEQFKSHIRRFSGLTARMIQHEFDHTNGVLYLHLLPPLTRKLLENKLKRIAEGKAACAYPLKFSLNDT